MHAGKETTTRGSRSSVLELRRAVLGLASPMKCFLFALWLWLPLAAPAFKPLEPLQIAQQFVAPAGWAGMKEYLCCEAASQAKQETLGQQIPAKLQRTCQLVQQGPATAVVAVELRDSVGRGDFYLHFNREGAGWKLQAIRSLSMTHLGPPMVNILSNLGPAEIADYDQKHPEASHTFTLGSLKLWTSTDAEISAHFARNRAEFQEVLRLVQAGNYFDKPSSNPEDAGELAANANPAVHALLRKLFVGRVTRRAANCVSCLEFVIGGKVNSTVGLLYQPNAALLPAMSPEGLIVLKPLGNGWYLYKTA